MERFGATHTHTCTHAQHHGFIRCSPLTRPSFRSSVSTLFSLQSTLFKQIRKNYGSPPDEYERKKHHIIVIQNVVRSIKSLIYHSERLLQRLPFSALSNNTKAATTTINPKLAESRAFIESVNLYKLFEGTSEQLDTSSTGPSLTSAAMTAAGVPVVKLNPSGKFIPQVLTVGSDGRHAREIFQELLTHCFLLWNDPGLKCTFENRAHFDFHQLFDSDSYFLHKLATGALLQDGYVPSDEDLIRVRIRTTAINSIDFRMKVDENDRDSDAVPMRMLDVAGQRSERKKWSGNNCTAVCVSISCVCLTSLLFVWFVCCSSLFRIPYFQDATAVIFVAAISEYDQVLCEDGITNRLMESIHLFTEIMNSSWFMNTPIVLFLNKCDLFAEKIKRVPLNILFPKYSGSTSYQTACEFLCREFVKRRSNPNKVIHIHVVSAIQIDLIKTAMDSVKTMLIESSLEMAGLMQ